MKKEKESEVPREKNPDDQFKKMSYILKPQNSTLDGDSKSLFSFVSQAYV